MYRAGIDPYCYAGTSILINKESLKAADLLDAFEIEVTSARMENGVPSGRLDAAHYLSIHKYIFQDVYEWAGEPRTIRISKGNSMFCYPENIQAELEKCFVWLKNKNYLRQLSKHEFANGAAHFLAELNAVHTFREGNGRTQLSFLTLLAQQAQHPINLLAINPANFMRAMIASFNGDESLLAQQIHDLATARKTPQ